MQTKMKCKDFWKSFLAFVLPAVLGLALGNAFVSKPILAKNSPDEKTKTYFTTKKSSGEPCKII